MTSVLWFRRDLRLADHPALLAACDEGEALPLVVLEPGQVADRRPPAQRLLRSLAALHEATGGALVVRSGDPVEVVPEVAAAVRAARVHITRDATPHARRRDEAVGEALSARDAELVTTGTPYAIGPGLVTTGEDAPYKVFTPFARAWRDHGWPLPADRPSEDVWVRDGAERLADIGDDALDAVLAAGTQGVDGGAGETAALERWRAFLDDGLEGYDTDRDRPDLDATSRMSVHLAHGEIHPRTMLADIAAHPAAEGDGAERFVTELAWREFYGDVLWHRPDSAWQDLRGALADLPYDDGPETDLLVKAWRAGRTGYPFVDAGMRQLAAEGYLHNRVPDQGPARVVAGRGTALPRPPARRRPRVQLARLAVGRGDRDRRVAVLPGLQPRDAGQALRPRRRLRAAMGARARAPARPGRPHPVDARTGP